jgi:hypothetical protein
MWPHRRSHGPPGTSSLRSRCPAYRRARCVMVDIGLARHGLAPTRWPCAAGSTCYLTRAPGYRVALPNGTSQQAVRRPGTGMSKRCVEARSCTGRACSQHRCWPGGGRSWWSRRSRSWRSCSTCRASSCSASTASACSELGPAPHRPLVARSALRRQLDRMRIDESVASWASFARSGIGLRRGSAAPGHVDVDERPNGGSRCGQRPVAGPACDPAQAAHVRMHDVVPRRRVKVCGL